MFNKKLLAVSVAGIVAGGAQAAVDLDANSGSITVATELAGSSTVTIADSGSADALQVRVDTGVNVAISDTIYVRFDLGNAEFNEAVVPADLLYDADGNFANASDQVGNGTDNFTTSVVNGGAAGDDFVVFSVTDSDSQLDNTAGFVFDNDSADNNVDVKDADASVTIQYRVWAGSDAATEAANETGTPIKDSTARTLIAFATGQSGDVDITNTNQLKADVSETFKKWVTSGSNDGAQSSTVANLGAIDLATTGVASGVVDLTAGSLSGDEVYDQAQVLDLAGTFSFGNWHLDTGANCAVATTALTVDGANGTATAASGDYTGSTYYLCSTVNGTDTIPKVSTAYTITAKDDNVTATLGTIGYNSSTIELDYLTTFSDYNQRLYLVNNGSSDAAYSITFTSESGTTCTAIQASGVNDADGTIPDGEMIVIKARDMVTVTGNTTRCAGTVEVEGTSSNIRAATQTISGDSTDTVYLTVQ